MMKTKIKNMFIGIALGDSLGMPFECMTSDEILKLYPNGINDYVSPKHNKMFANDEIGTYTDDTVLTLAVAEALLSSKKFDMDIIAQKHVDVFHDPKGWGGTTKEAVQRLRDGVHWSKSASVSQRNKVRGVGNGVIMKLAPLSAYHYLTNTEWKQAVAECVAFTTMTHDTSIAISSTLSHSFAIKYCLEKNVDTFDEDEFIEGIISEGKKGQVLCSLKHDQDDIIGQFEKLKNYKNFTPETIKEFFGKGNSYCFYSLPLTYSHFLIKREISGMFDLICSGGDTDTNASMYGCLLGALGFEFPKNLVDKLQQSEVLLGVADRYLAQFN